MTAARARMVRVISPSGRAPQRLWLLGPMAVGKTTIGRAVATRLGWEYVDNDAELARRTGQPLAAWTLGPELHAVEAAVIAGVVERPGPLVAGIPASVGDSAVLLGLLADSGRCVLLTSPVPALVARAAGTSRPLGADAVVTLTEQVARRLPAYARVAELVLDTSQAPPGDTAAAICAWLGVGEPGARATDWV